MDDLEGDFRLEGLFNLLEELDGALLEALPRVGRTLGGLGVDDVSDVGGEYPLLFLGDNESEGEGGGEKLERGDCGEGVFGVGAVFGAGAICQDKLFSGPQN